MVDINKYIEKFYNALSDFKQESNSDEEYYNNLIEAKEKVIEITKNASEIKKRLLNVFITIFDSEIKTYNKINVT